MPEGVFVLTSQEKWTKLKDMLQEIWEMLKKDPAAISRKHLEQIRGFIMHVAQTYPFIASYMIGIHMTIDGLAGRTRCRRMACKTKIYKEGSDRQIWVDAHFT
jgi:hypothetical protein